MARRSRTINLPAPYLKRIWLEPSRIADREIYPFCLPLLSDEFELEFERAITICGDVLAQHAPPRPHDKDELPNRLILLD